MEQQHLPTGFTYSSRDDYFYSLFYFGKAQKENRGRTTTKPKFPLQYASLKERGIREAEERMGRRRKGFFVAEAAQLTKSGLVGPSRPTQASQIP